jgi:hypothetical protein
MVVFGSSFWRVDFAGLFFAHSLLILRSGVVRA